MIKITCQREPLENFAVTVGLAAELLQSARVQRSDTARDLVARSSEDLRARAAEFLEEASRAEQCTAGAEQDTLCVDRDVLCLACYGVLHALRAHDDARQTAFEEDPGCTLLTMMVLLCDLAEIPEDEDRERARRRLLQQGYFHCLPATGAGERVPSGHVVVSADHLADLASELDQVITAYEKHGALVLRFARTVSAHLFRLNELLHDCLEAQEGPGVVKAHNARLVPLREARRWVQQLRSLPGQRNIRDMEAVRQELVSYTER